MAARTCLDPYAGRVQQRSGQGSGWVVGRAAGAPVVVEPSVLVGALVLAAAFYPAQAGLGSAALLVAAVFVVVLFASVLLHELAHGLVGRALGHHPRAFTLTLWGGHTTFKTDLAAPGRSALVAFAGPVANLLLGAAFFSLWTVADVSPVMGWMLANAAWINVVLGVFNLVPGLPLDGGHILEALVWKITGRRTSGTVAAAWIGRAVAAVLVVAVVVTPYLRGGSPSVFGVIWAVIIAWTLWSGASGALRYVRHTAALGTLSPASVGRRAGGVVANTSVAQALGTAQGASAEAVVVLGPDGRPAAYVDPTAVASVPREAVGVTAVSAVAVPLPEGAVVDVSVTGEQLLAAFRRTGGAAPLVVTAGGRVVAVVLPGDAAQVLQG